MQFIKSGAFYLFSDSHEERQGDTADDFSDIGMEDTACLGGNRNFDTIGFLFSCESFA